MDEMEERYLNTFRNLDETRQTQLREENCRPQRQATDITKPTFYGNRRDQHPRDFINELREYFAIKQIYDEVDCGKRLFEKHCGQLVFGNRIPTQELRRVKEYLSMNTGPKRFRYRSGANA